MNGPPVHAIFKRKPCLWPTSSGQVLPKNARRRALAPRVPRLCRRRHRARDRPEARCREFARYCGLRPASSRRHRPPRRRRPRGRPAYAPSFPRASRAANHSGWRLRFLTARSESDRPRQGTALRPKCNRSRAGLRRRHAAIRAAPPGHSRHLESGAGARPEPEASAAPPAAARAMRSGRPNGRSGQGPRPGPYLPNRTASGSRDRAVCRTATGPTPGPRSSRRAFGVPPAGDEVVVDHAGRLTKGVDDGGAAESEPSSLQILGYLHRERGVGRDFGHVAIMVLDRPAVEKAPEVIGKAFAFLNFQPCAGRGNGAFDFCAVADNAGILHQGIDLRAIVADDLFRIELIERGAKRFALAQYRDPGQPGLEPIEHELFIERPVVALRHTPFLVMIGKVERVVARPWAVRLAVEA